MRHLAAAAVALLTVSGCGAQQYRNDHRVSITHPENRSTVTVPFTVRWTYRDFDATGPTGRRDSKAGYFGVFIDRSPMPAGKHLDWIAKDDRTCKKADGCPSVQYLADHHVFTTTKPELVVSTLPATNIHTPTERHEVTVVLLDGAGHRIGESAWYVAVDYKRKRGI